MERKEEPEVMGRFGVVYGIKGWLKVISFTQDPESLFSYTPWFFRHKGQPWQPIAFEGYRRHGDGFIAKIKNIDVREEAQSLTNAEIGILGSSLPKLAEGEYRWRDLIGLAVVNRDNYEFGQVSSMMETGSNDVMVVKAKPNDEYGQKERLIPFLPHVVDSVDLENQTIHVDWDPDF